MNLFFKLGLFGFSASVEFTTGNSIIIMRRSACPGRGSELVGGCDVCARRAGKAG